MIINSKYDGEVVVITEHTTWQEVADWISKINRPDLEELFYLLFENDIRVQEIAKQILATSPLDRKTAP